MSGRLFGKWAVPAAIMAALLVAGPAWAQPRPPGPPPMGPPPMRPMGPPPMRPMGPPPLRPPTPPAVRPPAPPTVHPPTPPTVRPPAPPTVRPAAPLSSLFARPTLSPSRGALLARPNVGGSPSLSGRSGAWAPPAVNRGWDRPTANLGASRSTTFNRGNVIATINRGINDPRTMVNRGNSGINDRWPFYPRDLHNPRSLYGWVGSYSAYYPYYGGGYDYSYYPDTGGYYSGYSPYSDNYSYSPYSSSYLYGGSYRSSESRSDSEDSGSSDRASRSSAASDKGEVKIDKESAAAERRMDLARRAFKKGDYFTAQGECERAIRLLPGDANLHEFLALCQFAQEEYKDASATLHEVLAAGPGWSWNTLSSFYPSEKTYTTQLRALEKCVKDNPRDAAARFVLAYHYLALDERDAAAEQLREVVKLQPKDKVAPAILKALE